MACAGCRLGDMHRSCYTYRLKCERLTHIGMFLVFFFGIITIGAHHSVASMIDAMISGCCNSSSPVLSLSQYANGIERSVMTQNGLASLVKDM